MAIAGWLNLSATEGSGDSSVYVGAKEHTGRNVRTTTLKWVAGNVNDVERTVKQSGKLEGVSIAETASADKAGNVVTISGVSNSKKLTFSLGTGDLTITLPSTYTANSVSTSNGAEIDGDPGAVAEYNFSIQITVPPNTSATAKTRQIIVTAEGGQQDVCLLTSASGDAYVTVPEGEIALNYQGTAVEVQVKSNTKWRII